MDAHNRFLTPATYRAWRLEHLAGLVACVALLVVHLGDIRWWAFALLFAAIDVIGYLPGASAFRRGDGRVPPLCYVLYNVTHNFLTQGVIAGAWCIVAGPEWALLAIPIHLLGDRALFGNFLKPLSISFEPRPTPSFDAFQRELDRQEIAT